MLSRRLLKVASPLLLGSVLLAACGGGEDDENGGGTTTTKTVKIGFISPLTGDLSALGIGMKNSVQLAIDQANKDGKLEGWKIELAAEDDTATANVGAQVATKLAGDDAVAAVIGTLNSSVAQQVQPILNNANIAMVSPANTNPTLTQGTDANNKKRPYKTYFRVATTDAIQGPFAANYVYNDVKATKVVVIHDKKTYGQGLTDAFKAQFVKNGGTVVSTETINAGDKDFSAVISKIKGKGAQLIYYGGEYPEAAPLSKQAKQAGVTVPLMGGDGIYSGKFIELGGPGSEGDLATSVGAPTEQLETAKKFVADYTAAGFKDPYEAYGAYAYDSANVIIEALKKALGKDDTVKDKRQAIVDAIQATQHQGVTGNVAFDEFGDTTTKVLTVYKVTKGTDGKLAWKPEKVDEFK